MMRPSLPSAVACLALAAFLAETRLELANLRGEAETARRRCLGESGAESFVTAGALEAELGQLRAEGAAAAEKLEQRVEEKLE
eukprot:COSAG04_NODE_21621_length_370_cov_1.321033_1_plen_82_part_01